MLKYPTFDAGPVCYAPNPDRPWEMALTLNPCYGMLELPETGSVQEYIVGHCEAFLSEALCAQICNGQLRPGKGTMKVPQPDRVYASSAYISKVYFSQASDTVVNVEVILITTLDLYAFLGDMTVTDQREEWFSICGVWNIGSDDAFLPTWGRFSVYKKKDRTKERGLDEYLVPIMDGHVRREEAMRMLAHYYPEALRQIVRLDPRVLAERMGLTILFLPLVDKDDYLAMLFCRDSVVEVVNHETGEIVSLPVHKDTIVLNAQTVGKDETNKAAKAIIHECMHRYSHRLFWLFQRLYCTELSYFTCPVETAKNYGGIKSPLRWLEIQADALTRAVQIPDATVHAAVATRLEQYRETHCHENNACVMRMIIRDLSELYGVSKKQMRKRLLELGYEDAVGAYDWVDGQYVPPYCFAPGSLGKHQSYTISVEDMAKLYGESTAFRAQMGCGGYLYLEGRVCVNTEKYIASGKEGVMLTLYARAHTDECCLRFSFRYHGREHQYENGVLHQEIVAIGKEYVFDTDDAAAVKKALEAAKTEMKLRSSLKKLPDTFGDTLFAHMGQQDLRVEKLAELCELSDTTIKKYRRDDVSGITSRVVVTLCIAMHLEPQYGLDLMAKAGLHFRANAEDGLLEFVLRHMYKSSLDACDAFLVAAKLKPLRKNSLAA